MRERTRLGRYAAIPVALIALLVATPPSVAEGGREFSGSYELNSVADLGDTVSVALTMEIFNHRDTAVYDVTLIVPVSNDPDAVLHTSTTPFIGSRESARFSADLVLGQEEYERWRLGLPPALSIEFRDAAGNLGRAIAEIALMSLSEAN